MSNNLLFTDSYMVTELTKEQIDQYFIHHQEDAQKEKEEENVFLENEEYVVSTCTTTNFFQKETPQLTITICEPLEIPQIYRLTNEKTDFFTEEDYLIDHEYLQETDQTKTNDWIKPLFSAYLSNKSIE